jgi:hypothetical protein
MTKIEWPFREDQAAERWAGCLMPSPFAAQSSVAEGVRDALRNAYDGPVHNIPADLVALLDAIP